MARALRVTGAAKGAFKPAWGSRMLAQTVMVSHMVSSYSADSESSWAPPRRILNPGRAGMFSPAEARA
jgi:hypothetical protein